MEKACLGVVVLADNLSRLVWRFTLWGVLGSRLDFLGRRRRDHLPGTPLFVTNDKGNNIMELNWVKCTNNNWCPLATVNLSTVSTRGVYIIWHTGNPSRVVRVGQGNISERLNEHRRTPEITKYSPLYVTWAACPANHLDGIEKYLADTWNPLVGDAFPNAYPIAVNSPWG
jgi:hypothetical protein